MPNLGRGGIYKSKEYAPHFGNLGSIGRAKVIFLKGKNGSSTRQKIIIMKTFRTAGIN
jgi:hypothetical protein